jgi:hypothetical protein
MREVWGRGFVRDIVRLIASPKNVAGATRCNGGSHPAAFIILNKCSNSTECDDFFANVTWRVGSRFHKHKICLTLRAETFGSFFLVAVDNDFSQPGEPIALPTWLTHTTQGETAVNPQIAWCRLVVMFLLDRLRYGPGRTDRDHAG